jgi:hypothetical protein
MAIKTDRVREWLKVVVDLLKALVELARVLTRWF